MPQLPLTGLRVLEITVVWAGPYCGSFLADLGAEVIRVESTNTFVPLTRGAAPHPPQAVIDNLPLYSGGVPDRVPGERPFNRSPMFNSHARNKRSMTVNLLEPGGREIFDRLVSISDVLIENNPTETMEKLGISYESLKAVKTISSCSGCPPTAARALTVTTAPTGYISKAWSATPNSAATPIPTLHTTPRC